MDLPTLHGERLVLRPLVEADLDALLAILAEPEVARWWGPQAEQPDRAELLGPEARFAVVVDGAVAGWLACEENTDPMYRSVGLDIFLTTPLHGQGLGREALRLAITHYLERGHHRFTIDPAAHNERAIRTYSAVGFRPVGRMRDYELGADGTWHDGLLMDLLASEFVPAEISARTRSRTSPRGRGARRPRRRPSSGCG